MLDDDLELSHEIFDLTPGEPRGCTYQRLAQWRDRGAVQRVARHDVHVLWEVLLEREFFWGLDGRLA